MSRSAPAGVRTYLGSVSPALFAQLSHLCGSGKGRSSSRGHGFDVERRLALRPRRSNVRTTRLVGPPVALALDVFARILAEVGRADDEDLEALWPGLVASPRAGRDAPRVPFFEPD